MDRCGAFFFGIEKKQVFKFKSFETLMIFVASLGKPEFMHSSHPWRIDGFVDIRTMTSAEVKSSGRVENQSSILSYIKLDCLTTYNNKVALCDFATTHNQSVKAFLIYFESQVEDFVVKEKFRGWALNRVMCCTWFFDKLLENPGNVRKNRESVVDAGSGGWKLW